MGDADIRNAVEPVIKRILSLLIPCHKVISLIVEDKLIGARVVCFGLVKLFFLPVFAVIKIYLPFWGYCLVYGFDIVEQRLIFGFIPFGDSVDMFYVGAEILV